MDFNELRQKVFEKTPVFGHILKEYGHLPLQNYFSRSISAPCLVTEDRKNELLSVVEERLRVALGPVVAAEVCRELGERYAVSTADHHGPLAHPFFLSCHLAQSAALSRGTYRSIFVFSCGGVSLNNSSFPRGLLVHTPELELVRLPLFSLKHRHESVYGHHGYTEKELEGVLKHVREHKSFSAENKGQLLSLVTEMYGAQSVLSKAYYADQITATNHALWKKIPGQEEFNFIMLQQEDIVVDLLVRYHFGRGTLLEKLFTSPQVLASFEVCFDGILGAFSRDSGQGTVLVWAQVGGERVALKHIGNELISVDGAYCVPLESQTLRDAFLQKELLPSMALSFMVLSFYYGLTCGGGFSQVNYLADMRQAYLRFLEHSGISSDEGLVAADIETDRLTAETAYVFLSNHENQVPTTALDLALYKTVDTSCYLKELSEYCTLAEAVDQLMPEFYRILYHESPPLCAQKFAYLSALYV
jgi:hypothetical protein